MCGRAACTLAPAAIEDRYKPKNGFRNAENYHPSVNIAPFGKAYLPVLSLQQDSTKTTLTTDVAAMRWGLIPVWQKDEEGSSDNPKSFNARLETVKEKKMFKRLLPSKRCVVLIDGFYEWTKDGFKQPYFFKFKNEPLTLAGLMDVWHSKSGGIVESFTILTTDAPDAISPIHDRMPAIINQANMNTWLDPSTPIDAAIKCIYDPENIQSLVWYPVTKSVGNIHYDKKDCVEELSAPPPSANTNVKSNITKFFHPVSKAKMGPSPNISRFFTSPKKDVPPPTNAPHRNFDEEVEDLPDEVFDWPEMRTENNDTPQQAPQQTPPQTVPQSPHPPAQQPPQIPQPATQTVPQTPPQTVPQSPQAPHPASQPATPQTATPQQAAPQPATPQPATPQPATPQPATQQPATPQPASQQSPQHNVPHTPQSPPQSTKKDHVPDEPAKAKHTQKGETTKQKKMAVGFCKRKLDFEPVPNAKRLHTEPAGL